MYVQLCSGIVLLYIHAMLNPSLPLLKYILHGIILADETNIYLDYTVCYFLDCIAYWWMPMEEHTLWSEQIHSFEEPAESTCMCIW